MDDICFGGDTDLIFGQTNKSKYKAGSANQFTLFDVQFTYTKADADSSKPSKSHFYVKGDLINADRPKDWTNPVDFRNGTVHIRLEVLEKAPGDAPTVWTLCYIPNKGQGNNYGCTGTQIYTKEGVYERDIDMNSFGKINLSSGLKVSSRWIWSSKTIVVVRGMPTNAQIQNIFSYKGPNHHGSGGFRCGL